MRLLLTYQILLLQKYLNEAEKDKERYYKEMEAYQKTDAFKQFKMLREKRLKGTIQYIRTTIVCLRTTSNVMQLLNK